MHYQGRLYVMRSHEETSVGCLVRGRVGTVSVFDGQEFPALIGRVVWDFTPDKVFGPVCGTTDIRFWSVDWYYARIPGEL